MSTSLSNPRLKFEVRGLISNSPKGRISAIHAAGDDRLFVGTTAGVLALYRIKAEKTHISDHGVTHELIVQRDVPAIISSEQGDGHGDSTTIFTEGTPPSSSSSSSAAAAAAAGNDVVDIQSDTVNRLLFVHFQNPSVGLCLLNMDTLDLLSVNVAKARDPVSVFAVDKNGCNMKVVAVHGHSFVLYSYAEYKQTSSVTRVRTIASKYNNISYLTMIDHHVICVVRGNDFFTLFRLKEATNDSTAQDVVVGHNWEVHRAGKSSFVPSVLHIENHTIMIKSGAERWVPARVDGVSSPLMQQSDGNSNKKHDIEFASVRFSHEPKAVAISFPYVAGFVGQTIEIYSLYGQPHQHTSTASHVVNFTNPCLITGSGQHFYVVSDSLNDVFVLLPPRVEEQIEALTQDLLLSQSQHLFMRTYDGDEHEKRLRLMKMQENAGFSCLFRARFKQAFENFLRARETCPNPRDRMDVREILQFFEGIDEYKLLSDELYTQFKSRRSFKNEDIGIDRADDIGYDASIVLTLDKRFEKALAADDTSIANMSRELGLGDEHFIKILVHKAMTQLCVFLEEIRNPMVDSELENSEQFIIEYALISLYLRRLKTDASAYECITAICQGPNKCSDVGLSKRNQLYGLLLAYGCYRHCAMLIKAAGPEHFVKALDTLKKNIHKDIFFPKFDGVDDAIQILRRMEGDQLMRADVRGHIAWVISKAPSKAVQIFTSNEHRTHQPEPAQILQFLETYPLDIRQRYLQYLIYDMDNQDETYHTEYCTILIDIVLSILPSEAIPHTLKVPAGNEKGILGQYRTQLLEHLRRSSRYDRTVVHDKLHKTVLYEEMVELYRSIGDHDEALKLIILKMRDHQYAERYCEEIFELEKQKSEQCTADDFNPHFITYAKICLSSGGHEENINAVQNLLHRRIGEIDPIQALSILPDEMTGADLRNFLIESIKNTHHRLRSSQVKYRVIESHSHESHRRHVKATKRSITVTLSTLCPVCHKPIGNTVFAVYPDMSPAHYTCMANQHKSPTLDGEFSTRRVQREKNRHLHPLTKRNFIQRPVDL